MSMFPELRDSTRDMIARSVARPSRNPSQPFGERIARDISPTRIVLALPGHMRPATYQVPTERTSPSFSLLPAAQRCIGEQAEAQQAAR